MPKNNISTLVKHFYSEHPFPWLDIESFNLKEDLLRNSSDYAKMIYMNIPYGKNVIDVGCGTGQFSCLLSLRAGSVLGVDFSKSSIIKANELKQRLGLSNVSFENYDILNDLGKVTDRFDYVFCNGVLHHLSDPEDGFLNLCKLLNPGSYILVGIYNRYGRSLFRIKKHGAAHKALQLLRAGHPENKSLNWEMDQYCHPHEVSFSFGDIMNWFSKNNIEYCSSMPPIDCFNSSRLDTRPFDADPGHDSIVDSFKRYFVELSWIWSLRESGGYSVIIGRSK